MNESQRAAVEALLVRARRQAVPIRRSFVQRRVQGGGPAPLAAFVQGRRRRALDLYLLLRAGASAPPWDVTLDAVVWARLLGLPARSGATSVARQWKFLEEQNLVSIERSGRRRRVYVLREDGSGAAYTHPGIESPDHSAEGDYFTLPHVYWRADLPDWSDLATKTMLLIALSLGRDFVLPFDRAPDWYGISKDTARSGIRSLLSRGLLEYRTIKKTAPLAPAGFTLERRYRLAGPFALSPSTHVNPPSETPNKPPDKG